MSSSEEAPLLSGGVVLKDRWEILRKIGRGGFGEIYKARDHDTGERCAVKAESAVSSKQVLKMEVAVLKRLQSCSPHICTLLGCGRTDKINYMVMMLLGPNLSELRKQQPKQRFSLSTTLRVGVQVIAAVHAIHTSGFLHRDIKPSNFAIGAASVAKQTCYMLDFGLARQYVTSDGEIRPPRPVAGFRGTVRYASINAHLSKDLGRHDDLWSVFYLLVELANGELPWKKVRDKDKAGKFKQNFDHKRLLKNMPAEFFDFLDHLKSLDYYQEPDYVMLSTLLQNAIRYRGIKRGDPLDWELDPSVQSLTTVSAGSAPALQTNQNGRRMREGGGDSGTNVSTEDCMSEERAKKELEIARKFSSNDENCRHRKSDKGAHSSTRPRQLNIVQQRRSMPPSPLLQATHLVKQGLPHTKSLDQFFDTARHDGKSHSSDSRNEKEQGSGNEDVQCRENLAEENCTRSQRKGDGRQRKSGSTTASSESAGRDNEYAPVIAGENKKLKIPSETGLEETPATKVPSNSDPQQNLPECKNIAVLTPVHPDSTPLPLVGYAPGDGVREYEAEQSSPSNSSCFNHRQFAGEIQTRPEPTDNVEHVPLETIAGSYRANVHSPGPPPLEFHEPQQVWGHDSMEPISLTPTGPPHEEERAPAMILPRPPDHPPPCHYTLLASRRRRFRRPSSKT